MKEVKSAPLVVVGFSGSGKTSLGECLRKKHALKVVDLDSIIEERSKKSIKEIIGVEGEEAFRKQEEEALSLVLDSKDFDLVVLGGGALISSLNRERLEKLQDANQIKIVSLAVSESVAASRVYADDLEESDLRPLLSSKSLEECQKKVSSLMKERKALYDLAKIKLWTDWASTEQIAKKLVDLKELKGSFISLPAYAGEESLGEVRISRGQLEDLEKSVFQLFSKATKVALLVDQNLYKAWGDKLERAFSSLELHVLELASGEKTKSFSELENALNKLLEFGLTRSDVIVAVGGGVVGDLAGLVASLYMRGVGLLHIPTTIVAQVDSAIGGKTAVNLEGGKNLVGTFYPASLILSDLELLESLPEREFRAGLAEVIKYGLIYDLEFFNWFYQNVEDICKRNSAAILKIVEQSSKAKLDFVCKDLRDLSGRRAMLNYGHTFGHVLEKLTGYGELLHGEAISIGMCFALFLGERHGKVIEESKKVVELFKLCKLPTEVPKSLLDGAEAYRVGDKQSKEAVAFYNRFYSAFSADKKRVSKAMHFVFLERVGQASVKEVAVESLVDAVADWVA